MSYEIYLDDHFKRAVKHYKKRYPSVVEDVTKVVEELQQVPTKGKVVPGWKGVRKIRVDNSDITKGKSGSYRLLYYVINQPAKRLILLSLLAKNEREDFEKKEVLGILRDAGLL